jgi:hypothetical protein
MASAPSLILALHGRSQTGEVFRTKLTKLVEHISPHSPEPTLGQSGRGLLQEAVSGNGKSSTYFWEFPDGPILLPSGERDQVRSWFEGPVSSADFGFPLDRNGQQPDVIVGFSQGGLLAVAAGLRIDSVRLVIVAGAPMDAHYWLEPFFRKTSVGKARKLTILL